MNLFVRYLHTCFAILAYRISILIVFLVPAPFVYALYSYYQDSSVMNTAMVILSILATPIFNITANTLVVLSISLNTVQNEPPVK